MTRAERAVIEVLAGREQFLSAQQIHADLRAGGSTVGLASVYRALQSLRHRGAIDESLRPGGEASYRRCRTAHHHHLTCTSCSRTVEIESATTERWVGEVVSNHGYTPTGHTIELNGLCPACQADGPNPHTPSPPAAGPS